MAESRPRMGLRLGIATLSLACWLGCSSGESTTPPAVPLCDGSAQLTLRVFWSGLIGRQVIGGAVRVENGFPSFAVDGQCQYFMNAGWMIGERQTKDMEWRQGVVSEELLELLEARVGFEDLPSTYECGSALVVDAPSAVVANVRSSLVCPGGAGQRLGEVFALFRDHARELWTNAQSLDGPLRITVIQAYGGEPARWYPWPSNLALGEYYEGNLDVPLEAGQSKLVDASDAAPLRTLREQYLRDTRPGYLYTDAGIPITDGETQARVFMRDALPYEDEQGLLPLP